MRKNSNGFTRVVNSHLCQSQVYIKQRYLRGVLGEPELVHRYLATIHGGTHAIHGVRVIGMTSTDEAIVGRDVLNQLHVTLDGSAETCMIHA